MWNYIKKLIGIFVGVSLLVNPLQSIALVTRTIGIDDGEDLNTDFSAGDEVRVSSYLANNGSGVLQSGYGRIKLSSAGSLKGRMVVYSDVAGTPTTLLATSNEVTVTNTSYQNVNFTFTGANQITITNGTTYWIGFHNEDPSSPDFQISYSSTGSTIKSDSDTYSDGSPSTFSETTSFTGKLNLIAYYQDTEVLGSTYPIINTNLYNSGLRVDFDGVDERLTDATTTYQADTKSGGRTLCMWFNLDSLPASETNRNLFSWSNSDAQGIWNFRIRTNRGSVPWTGTRWELQTALDTGAGTGTSTFIYSSAQTFTTGTDYNLCLVSSGTAWTLYVNGSSTTLTVTATGSGGNDGDWWGDVNGSGTITFTVGGTAGGANIIDGKIDDISYYDDDLTATEVSSLYNGGKPIHPMAVGLTDLSGYWKLGEAENGSITTIYDMRGTDNWSSINMENADIVTTSYY